MLRWIIVSFWASVTPALAPALSSVRISGEASTHAYRQQIDLPPVVLGIQCRYRLNFCGDRAAWFSCTRQPSNMTYEPWPPDCAT